MENPVNLRNLYCTASFIQWPEECSESEEPIKNCFIYSVIWGILWIWGTKTVLLHLFSDLRNPLNLRYRYCTASFIQWSEESSESHEPILNCFIYSMIWGIQWIWGTYTVLIHLFSDLRNPVNLRNLNCTALSFRWSEASSESIWGTYTVLLYSFSNLINLVNLRYQYYCQNPVNLRNLYCTASFIQWSEESSESEEPILYCFIYSVVWRIQ